MTSLRKEYSKSKKRNERIVSEAALRWLAENVIVINEKLDRKSVTRLIGSIQKFEDTFGPYKDRIPSIGGHLDAAESGLQLVITGKSSDHKTSNMLKQLSYLYSSLSDFFTRDLPVLLKARIFKVAKEQPDQRINALPTVTPDGGKHDLIVIRDSLANAIRPSVAEKKLLGKIYRSTKLPKLDANKIATELLALSFGDLEELTNIGKVPMVATPEEAEDVAELGAEEAAAPPAVPGEEAVAKENVTRGKAALTDFLQENNKAILYEMLFEQGVDVEKLKKMNQEIEKLRGITDRFGGKSTVIKAKVDELDSSINNLLTGDSKEGIISKVKQFFGGRPDIEKNMGDLYQQLRSFQQLWPQLKQRLGADIDPGAALDSVLDAERLPQIQKLLVQAMGKETKGGIDPTAFVQDLLKLSIDELDSFASGAPLTMDTKTTADLDNQNVVEPESTGADPAAAATGTAPTADASGAEAQAAVAGAKPAGTPAATPAAKQAVSRAILPGLAQKFGVEAAQLEKILAAFGHPIEG